MGSPGVVRMVGLLVDPSFYSFTNYLITIHFPPLSAFSRERMLLFSKKRKLDVFILIYHLLTNVSKIVHLYMLPFSYIYHLSILPYP